MGLVEEYWGLGTPSMAVICARPVVLPPSTTTTARISRRNLRVTVSFRLTTRTTYTPIEIARNVINALLAHHR